MTELANLISPWIPYALAGTVLWCIRLLQNFSNTYIAERTKLEVINAQFGTSLDQLKQTTDAQETIKINLAHQDWTIKEQKTLKRQKLEQLMTAVYATLDALDAETEIDALQREDGRLDSSKSRIELRKLTLLFFQELTNEVDTFTNAYFSYAKWRLVERNAIRKAFIQFQHQERLGDILAAQHPFDQTAFDQWKLTYSSAQTNLHNCYASFNAGYQQNMQPLRSTVIPIETAASKLMHELTTPK